MTDALNTLNDCDMYFYSCLAYQNKEILSKELKMLQVTSEGKKRKPGEGTEINFASKGCMDVECVAMARYGLFDVVHLKYMEEWLRTADTSEARITQQSFQTFVKEAKLGIPDKQVDSIFMGIVKSNMNATAASGASTDVDTSQGSSRSSDNTISYADCNNALRAYNSGGLWKDGVTELIKMAFPSGALKDMALHNVDSAFDDFDADGSGTIAPTEVGSLIMKLLTPGVAVEKFEELVADSKFLGFSIPRDVIHSLTDLVDANHDGYLQAEEFVSLLMAVVKSDVPQKVLGRLGVSPWHIIKLVLYSLMYLLFFFAMITLVIQSFTSGQGLAQVVQTISSGGSILYVKSQENSDMAKEEARLIAWAKEKVTEELAIALNISKQAVSDMKSKQGGDQDAAAKQ